MTDDAAAGRALIAAARATNRTKQTSGLAPGAVVGYDAGTNTARIVMDDGGSVVASSLIGVLQPADRVMLLFEPPRGVFVIGPVQPVAPALSGGLRPATVVVGAQSDGWTTRDVDFLALPGTADVALSAAFAVAAAKPGGIGTVLLLAGNGYTIGVGLNWAVAGSHVTITSLGEAVISGTLAGPLVTCADFLTIDGPVHLAQAGTGALIVGDGAHDMDVQLRNGVDVRHTVGGTGPAFDGVGQQLFVTMQSRAVVSSSALGLTTTGVVAQLTIDDAQLAAGGTLITGTNGILNMSNGARVDCSNSVFNISSTAQVFAADSTINAGSIAEQAAISPTWIGDLRRCTVTTGWGLGTWDQTVVSPALYAIVDNQFVRGQLVTTIPLLKATQAIAGIIGNRFIDGNGGSNASTTIELVGYGVVAFNQFLRPTSGSTPTDILIDATSTASVIRKNTGYGTGGLAGITDLGAFTTID